MFEWSDGNVTYLIDKLKIDYFICKDGVVFFHIGGTELRTSLSWEFVRTELQAHSQA